jgi:uncharacterized membrane protein YraQ (UPF0718 family)
MTLATAILAAIALSLILLAWYRDRGELRKGMELSWRTLRRTSLLLLLAFAIVGFVNVLSPQQLIRTSIGPSSGIWGVILGTAAGAVLPGGPYVVFPLISVIYKAGAGIGPTLAMITSWATLALISVSFEIPFLGWRFSAMRLSLSLSMPIIVGILGMLLLSH